MSKPKITITISGPAGSGKTTLADYIAAHLSIPYGFKVKLIDDDHEQALPTSTVFLPSSFRPEVTIITEKK